MNRSLKLFIFDILESINDIETFSNDLTKEKLENNKLKQNALIRSLEIIGEAVKNLPESFRKQYPDVKWQKIAGFRDIIIHAYFKIDLDVTWDVLKKDIPLLKKQIQKIKTDLEGKK